MTARYICVDIYIIFMYVFWLPLFINSLTIAFLIALLQLQASKWKYSILQLYDMLSHTQDQLFPSKSASYLLYNITVNRFNQLL